LGPTWPDLNDYPGWLIAAKMAQVDPAKAAACVRFDGEPGKGGGVLTWLITPDRCAGA
jgi:hypothetical protein